MRIVAMVLAAMLVACQTQTATDVVPATPDLLREIAQQPEDGHRLLASLRTMSPEMQRYKSLSVVRAPVEAYLSAQLEARGG